MELSKKLKRKNLKQKLITGLVGLATVTTAFATTKLMSMENDTQLLNSAGNVYELVGDSIGDSLTGITTTLSSLNLGSEPSSLIGSIDDAQVELGQTFGAILKTDGTVWTWGNNTYGQLGNGVKGNTNTAELTQVVGIGGEGYLENIKQISAGRFSVSAITDDGKVVSWGRNELGQLGNTTTTDSPTPVYVQKQVTVTNEDGTTSKVYVDLDDIVQISRGTNHALALASDGTVWAWGLNHYGQLGIGVSNTTASHADYKRVYAVKVQKQTTVTDGEGNTSTVLVDFDNVKQVSGGSDFSVALMNDGTAFSWGVGTSGQLGNNAAANSSLPVQVRISATEFLTDIKQLDAGGVMTLAVKNNGDVWSWGCNRYGSLGANIAANTDSKNGNYKRQYAVPVLISAGNPLTGIKSVSAMLDTGFALAENGNVYGWGLNTSGQIGDNTLANKIVATLVKDGAAPVTGIRKLAGGQYTHINYFIDNNGELWSNGLASSSDPAGACFQMTDRTSAKHYSSKVKETYLEVSNNQDYIEKGTTKNLTVSYHKGVSVNDYLPTLGTLTYSSSNSDIVSVNESGQIEAKERGTATIIVRDTTNNYVGEAIINVVTPGAKAIPMVESGTTFTAMLKEDGTVWTSGTVAAGELGNGSNVAVNIPTQVKVSADEYLTDVRKIAVGNQFVIALKTDGTVWAWGLNSVGQLGIGVHNATATHVNYKRIYAVQVCKPDGTVGLDNVVDIDAGADNVSVVTRDRLVYVWGDATNNGLALNNTSVQNKPVLLHQVHNAIQAQSGANNVMVLKGDGTVWGGGQNNVGQLADGTLTTPRVELVPSINKEKDGLLTGIVRIASGAHHTIALKENKTAYGWGYSDVYELGNNSTTHMSAPIDLPGENNTGVMENIYDIAVGPQSTIIKVVKNDGKSYAYATGLNTTGQLSINSKANAKVFTQVLDENLVAMTGIANISKSLGTTFGFVFEDGSVGITGGGVAGQHANRTNADTQVITRINSNLLITDEIYKVPVAGRTNINVRIEKGFNLNLNPVVPTVGTLEYTSLDESIATVSPTGEITGVKKGNTGILVKDTTNNIETIAQVMVGDRDLSDIYKVVAGQNHTVMLKNDGTVWAWGDKTNGRLGNGEISGKCADEPVRVLGVNGVGYLTDVIDVAAGADFTLALLKNGRVVSWGMNAYRTIRYNCRYVAISSLCNRLGE